MARFLIVGCGCRGRLLAGALRAEGHAVRGTTRDPARREAIAAAGAEPVVGDPDRVATLAGALSQVSVACLLLGSARGTPAELRALHSTRLEMLLERMVDTTVRGVVYERSGTVGEELLAGGAAVVRRRCERSLIPWVMLEADPSDAGGWLRAARAAAREALLGRPAGGR